jgi:hypothetical protein
VLDDEQGLRYAHIGCPIYRKMLLLCFVSPDDAVPVNGFLNFDGLLDHCKAFMTEHGVRLLKNAKTERPLEISGQYLLLSYPTAA